MKTHDVVYVCDVPGCRSRCTLTAAEDSTEELKKMGWAVVSALSGADASDGDEVRVYCPGCKSCGKIPREAK